jgi:hypothetical protein
MKRLTYLFGIIAVFLLTSFVPTVQKNYRINGLSDGDKNGLLLMRDEEKMAFDVYSFLDEKWDHQVFKNIKQSEARHGEFVKSQLEKYDIKDPYIEIAGKYVNADIQKLYQELISRGSNSIKDAFTVGAIIEDRDIYDLDKLLSGTKNDDLHEMYQTLIRGSRNHMRAFSRQLALLDHSYTPAFITKDMYETIIKSEQERGVCQINNSGAVGQKACPNSEAKSCQSKCNNNSAQGNKDNCSRTATNRKSCCR